MLACPIRPGRVPHGDAAKARECPASPELPLDKPVRRMGLQMETENFMNGLKELPHRHSELRALNYSAYHFLTKKRCNEATVLPKRKCIRRDFGKRPV